MNTKYDHTINLHTLNTKIVIKQNYDERCFDYHISNINRVEDKEINFFISYSSNAKTISQATIDALKEICEQYDEYCK